MPAEVVGSRFLECHGEDSGTKESPQILQGRVRVRQTLEVQFARSFSLSLLERRPVPGTGGDILSIYAVVRDARFG